MASDDDKQGSVNPSHVDPKAAAHRAVDDDRLLDGEDPATPHLEDVRHWITAYSELVEYKERLLATSARDRAAMDTDSAKRETSEIDVPILRRELDRYRRRLRFWESRQTDLSARGA